MKSRLNTLLSAGYKLESVILFTYWFLTYFGKNKTISCIESTQQFFDFFLDPLIVHSNYLFNRSLNYMVILIECGVDIFSGICPYSTIVVF